jgi:hypothetical protein
MPATIIAPSEMHLQTPADIARKLANDFYNGTSPFGHLKIPFDFNQADASTLVTLPAAIARIEFTRLWWEVTTSFTGGASSAIGVSSNNASYNTKGDLLGGAGGDVAATLVSTGIVHKGGTVGVKFGSNGMIVLVGGNTLRFDRIVSAFTAGVGFVHADYRLID